MAIQRWHWGKLLVLWGWGLLVVGLVYATLPQVNAAAFGFVLIGILFGVPLVLSCLTWIWLSGKERAVLHERRAPGDARSDQATAASVGTTSHTKASGDSGGRGSAAR